MAWSSPKLGRYEVLEDLGVGLTGKTYLARDPLIRRIVLLKTFAYTGGGVSDPEIAEMRARFIREAQTAGILHHPNIVTIYDIEEESGEAPAFIAMEYVQGRSLREILTSARKPLEPSFVVDVVSQVADALDYAHSHGIVHRDLKPASILIGGNADTTRAKITNFVIARFDTSDITQEGALVGTPSYLAPEQIMGWKVDHRADVFALGIVVYEMSTLTKPFTGENLTVVSHGIVYEPYPPPRQHNPSLPPEIELVFERALAKDPTRRYASAGQLAKDLRRSLAKNLWEFDIFICHASEDKVGFVEALAHRLQERGLRVWYDSYRLRVGDSLRVAIDEGLGRSRFGVVVLSPAFCTKDWPKRELEGLLALEREGRKVILPLWHGVSRADVVSFSPLLADRVALVSDRPLDRIVDEIVDVVRR